MINLTVRRSVRSRAFSTLLILVLPLRMIPSAPAGDAVADDVEKHVQSLSSTNPETRARALYSLELRGARANRDEAEVLHPRLSSIRSLKPQSIQRIPMEDKDAAVRLKEEGKDAEIPVELIKRYYDCREVKITNGKVASFVPQGSLFCYELRSKEQGPFSWCFWSTEALGCFRLFHQEGRTHLAFVRGLDVVLAPVEGRHDSAAELAEFIKRDWTLPAEFIWVPVSDLVDRDKFHGRNALYEDDLRIDRVSVRGTWSRVTVSSRQTSRSFRLEGDDGKWRLR